MCYLNYRAFTKIKKAAFILEITIPVLIISFLLFYAFSPQSYVVNSTALITVNKGDSLKNITFKLYRKKAVKNPYLFYFIGFISGYSRYIEAGTYFVSSGQSPASIYHELVNGNIATVRVTIPPGLNMFQVSRLLANKNIVKQKDFLKECLDKKFLLSLSIDKGTVEGYLYPDTYSFKVHSSARVVIEKMVYEFNSRIRKLEKNYPGLKSKNGLSYKSLIVASMITKEANGNIPGDMKMVSSVIHNRLKKKMPLDIDSTSIYAVNLNYYKEMVKAKRPSNLNLAETMKVSYLKFKSPYNTYMNYGLPPAPIANPGIKAIVAALRPAASDYLYYISTRNGRVIFAKTLAAQNNNIRKFMK